MISIYSVEVYHYDKDAWTPAGYFASLDEAKKAANAMCMLDPHKRYSVFLNESCVYSV